MMPPDVQELIFQHAETIEDFKAFEEKITTLVSNRAEVEPVPMDIGKIEAEWYKYHEMQQQQECEPCEEGPINWVTVGSGMCFN